MQGKPETLSDLQIQFWAFAASSRSGVVPENYMMRTINNFFFMNGDPLVRAPNAKEDEVLPKNIEIMR